MHNSSISVLTSVFIEGMIETSSVTRAGATEVRILLRWKNRSRINLCLVTKSLTAVKVLHQQSFIKEGKPSKLNNDYDEDYPY
ncbi:hypothetical protein VP501E541_P0255 [Vibrio phage 501E54-1]|nr:hypothetical protein VP501E541_P0255 [Vibrio phage 501E54-1]